VTGLPVVAATLESSSRPPVSKDDRLIEPLAATSQPILLASKVNAVKPPMPSVASEVLDSDGSSRSFHAKKGSAAAGADTGWWRYGAAVFADITVACGQFAGVEPDGTGCPICRHQTGRYWPDSSYHGATSPSTALASAERVRLPGRAFN